MSWLGKLFARSPVDAKPRPARQAPPRDEGAVRISTESVTRHCERMEAEARRSGNRHLAVQAARIRARLT